MEPQDIFAVSGEPSLVVEVEDSGIGIAEEDLDRIFEAFVQVDNSATREFGGTGLGLVIVKKFVEEHGGRVSVRSTVGSGTVFTCLFPANPPSQGETGEP
jgi:signal transduction histidine kinase